MRDAVMLLDQITRIGIKDAEGFREQFGIKDVSEELFRAALKGDLAEGSRIIGEQYRSTGDVTEMVTHLTLLVRDLLVIRGGGAPDQMKEKIEARRPLASEVEDPMLVRVIGVLWDLRARVRGFDTDQRAAMEMAFVLVAEALRVKEAPQMAPGSPQEARVAPVEPRVTIGRVREVLAS
jgi:DNA polymerase III gamma/tau subunit